jgi:hypothetical protein
MKLIIFLKFVKQNFTMYIWNLGHKKNSLFPEHRADYNFIKREKFINYDIFHGFRTVVAPLLVNNEMIKKNTF